MKIVETSISRTIITANQRLALHMRQHNQLTEADSLPLNQWIIETYHVITEKNQKRHLLTEQQELILWEQVIVDAWEASQPEVAFLSIRSLAKTAQSAWHILKKWQVPLTTLATFDSQEISTFYQWAVKFSERCKEKGYIDNSTCAEEVIRALAKNKITLTPNILLVGFEEIPPQTKQLFDLLATQCTVQYQTYVEERDHCVEKIALLDNEAELSAMAQWAAHIQHDDPSATIGCVVPDLNTHRQTVERIFTSVFDSHTKFNLSGGLSFLNFPLIQTAFHILKLGTHTLDINILSRLLGSPFIGGAEQERIARASLDVQLRETLEPHIHVSRFLYLAERQQNCMFWIAQCQNYFAYHAMVDKYQSASAWAQHFTELLQSMGWPGERALNRAEFQATQRWQKLLEELGHLDVVLDKPLSRTQALHHLTHLAQSTVFQEQSSYASVQILGQLEAVGFSFDYLWISGMTQEEWPKGASPNPFIPLKLQRDLQMPHASAERELAYCHGLTQCFARSAPHVIFSYALSKDGQAQMASALLKDIPTSDKNYPKFDGALRSILEKDTSVEYLLDEIGPAFEAQQPLRGGASVFKHQSACPFRAFARIRLNAVRFPDIAFNLLPHERGTYLHAALEKIWQTLKDHKTLCEHDDAQLRYLVESKVKAVLHQVAQKRAITFKPRLLALEQQRLTTQILNWLALEKQRPPFQVVNLEAVKQVNFAGLSLQLRLDREDVLADGSHLMIDYKTGLCHTANWFGERPDEPQLPLYALTCEYPVDGLAFAQLWPDKLAFAGISKKDNGIAGFTLLPEKTDVADSWRNFYEEQKLTLTRLATEFQTGYAKVDPKAQAQTCQQCDLQSLCRVHV